MSHDPEIPNEQDEFDSYDGYDPFTARGSDYDDAWAPPGDRCGRALDFTDLDYVDEDESGIAER